MASNYIELPVTASGGTVNSVAATSPIASSGGNDPIISLVGASATEISYLAGVTSAIQTQLNSKQATAFTPDDSGVWDGDPATIEEAINRIAAVVGAMVPIP